MDRLAGDSGDWSAAAAVIDAVERSLTAAIDAGSRARYADDYDKATRR